MIGITGGVGAGKSEILSKIKTMCRCRIIIADETAHELEQPGKPCYQPLIDLLGEIILDHEQKIDKGKLAAAIFEDASDERLRQVNRIVHPAVKEYILHEIEFERMQGRIDYLFIEAALLIEDGYIEICDELWYIYADRKIREQRLRETRGYSEEKIKGIMDAQSSEETFRKYCSLVIDNSHDIAAAEKQLRERLS